MEPVGSRAVKVLALEVICAGGWGRKFVVVGVEDRSRDVKDGYVWR